MTQEAGLYATIVYAYDLVGNRLTRAVTGSTTALLPNGATTNTYDNNDRLTTGSHTYDADGNETTVNGQTATYDFEDHLVALGSGVANYIYDADGNRYSASSGGTTTSYVTDTSLPYASVVEEYTGSTPTLAARYDYGDDLIRMDRVSPASTSYYLFDGLGSTRQLVSTAGTVTDTYAYDAFGEQAGKTGSTANPFLFNAQQLDAASGDYYLRARYYDQSNGRFISQDPYGGSDYDPVSLHRYLYASVDPVDRVDPGGQADGDNFTALRGTSIHNVIGDDFLTLGPLGTRFVNDVQISRILGLPSIAKLTKFEPDLVDIANPYRKTVFQIKPLDSKGDAAYELARDISILNAASVFGAFAGAGLPSYVPGNFDDYSYKPILITPIPAYANQTFHTQTAIVFPTFNGLILYDIVDNRSSDYEVRLKQSEQNARQAQGLAEAGASAEELETLIGRTAVIAAVSYAVAPLVTTAIAGAVADLNASFTSAAVTAPLLGGL